jgi:sarcosine oxidase/L-pipecolate oxidase
MFHWVVSIQAYFFGYRSSSPVKEPNDASYIIVGSGIFGASTALHLIRKYPAAKVTIIDREPFPCRLAASWDWNKVVRADYTDLLYMKLALEAKESWSNDALFNQFYHRSGMFWISDTNLARTVIDNYKKLDAKEEFELLGVKEAKKRFGGMFEDADYTGVSEILINNSSGHAEAKEALGATIQAALNAGVQYLEADVQSLVMDGEGACKGVNTAAGETLTATHIILCTGAGTAKLLADTTPYREELQVGGRMIAAAICTGLAKLDTETALKYVEGPVCCQDVLSGRGTMIFLS